jgi:hypothetical protein
MKCSEKSYLKKKISHYGRNDKNKKIPFEKRTGFFYEFLKFNNDMCFKFTPYIIIKAIAISA